MVLPLYVLSYRRLDLFRLLNLLLLLYRFLLRRFPTRSQVTHRDESGCEDEKSSESASYDSPSLKPVVLFRRLPVSRPLLTVSGARF